MKKLIYFLLAVFVIVYACSKDNNEAEIRLKYNLTTEVTPVGGGTISPASGSYNEGHQVSLTAKPSAGYTFKNWSGAATGTDLTTKITMSSHKKVTAVFEKEEIVYTNGEGLIGTRGGTVRVDDSSSPLDGAYVIVPEDALSSDKNIKISLSSDGVEFPYERSGVIVKFEPEGLQFQKEIEIGIPYPNGFQDTLHLSTVNYVLDPEEIIETRKIKIDQDKSIIKSSTDHFSYYLAWDKNIRLQAELLNINDKIGARLNIVGLDYQSESLKGLRWVRTSVGHYISSGKSNLWQCLLEEKELNAQSIFIVDLFEYNTLGSKIIKREKLRVERKYEGTNVVVDIYHGEGNEKIFSSGILDFQDINNDKKSLGNWLSGKPLVFNFESDFKSNKKYFIEVRWALGSEPSGNPAFNHSPKFGFNNKEARQSIDEMELFDGNKINKNIHDEYNLWGNSHKTYVPDDNFEQKLIDFGYDDVLDNYVLTSNIDEVDDLFVPNEYINDLTGIEDFKALTTLWVSNNELKSLDVSKNKNLSKLYCNWNQLTSLDVSQKTALTELNCSYNQITKLDVSQNTNLEQLLCNSNKLTTLDVSQNTALIVLQCSGNSLTTLDVSQNTILEVFGFYSNQLTTFDVSQNTALTDLSCSGNSLTTIDVSQNTALTELSCSGNQLTTLDVSQNTALIVLQCHSNQLTNLDVSKNTDLSWLWCYSNQLTSLNVNQHTDLRWLLCYSNQLTSLNVSQNIILNTFECYDNHLTCVQAIAYQIGIYSGTWELGSSTILSTDCSNTNSDTDGDGILFNPNLTYGSVNDNNGNTYKTIVIGTQTWMAENLKTTKYKNGEEIEYVNPQTGVAWGSTTKGAFRDYNGDTNSVEIYGWQYNGYAILDSRGICPQGWHVPSGEEMKTLSDFIGNSNRFNALAEVNTSHWDNPISGATNSTGFTGIPGGELAQDGIGQGAFRGLYGIWWTSSVKTGNLIQQFILSNYSQNQEPWFGINADAYINSGACVRCVKD